MHPLYLNDEIHDEADAVDEIRFETAIDDILHICLFGLWTEIHGALTDVNQVAHVNGELAQNGEKDIGTEDVGMWTDFGQNRQRLSIGQKQKHSCNQ